MPIARRRARRASRQAGRTLVAAVASLVMALGSAGCLYQVREQPPEATPGPRAAAVDLAALGIRRVAVVELDDRTWQGAGEVLARAMTQALSSAGVPVAPDLLRRPSSHLARSWLEARARALGVDAFVSGHISAYSVQPQRNRAYVALTAVLLDRAGEILWSKRVSGSSPLSGLQAALPNERILGNNGASMTPPYLDQAGVHRDALAVAATIAAKEFAHDLAAFPQP